MMRALTPLLILPLLLAGCARSADDNAANAEVQASAAQTPTVAPVDDIDAMPVNQPAAAVLPTDKWVGSWAGPEGLYLNILASSSGESGNYLIVNKDTLDRQNEYSGTADGESIRFQRDGQNLTIRAGTGKDSGFKYLADKQDCLIVIPGKEGYCR